MNYGVTLRTERLTLRAPRPDDAAWIGCEIARPEVHRWLTAVPRPYGLADAEDWIEANAGGSGAFVIDAGGDPLGALTLGAPGTAPELGYWLKRAAWGRGIMTEAARAALGWQFSRSDATVASGHIVGNAASRRVLAKLGFADTGRVMRPSRFHGHDVEIQRMILARATWEANDAD
ncbi:MAG: GNAT family N-acetyltransferase [Maritimibacter sp.]|nr:GNAT family N-acetyltransferase [Maritimibacter sp.]